MEEDGPQIVCWKKTEHRQYADSRVCSGIEEDVCVLTVGSVEEWKKTGHRE
jgi:hypothetical protein